MRISSLYLIKKHDFACFCFGSGVFLAYLDSLNPWFLWPLGALYIVPAAFLVLLSMLVSSSMREPIFIRQDFLLPLSLYIVLSFYMSFVNNGNINAFIGNIFHIILFFSLFAVDKALLFRLSTWLSKAMALLLLFSIPFYFLYLLGFQLPSVNAQYGDGLYSYTNYFFFMVDDRSLFVFPRFHSVFLEPGHLGTATVLLLFAQCGHWRKWYNFVLWLATLMTFSLAAYVLSLVIIFLNLWLHRKHIFRKLFLVFCAVGGLVVGAFFYNGGDNLLHDLILLRLEVDDEGELSGDNRVAGWFENEYESYLQSSDVFFGRDYDYSISGNSGYRLFIYENGFVGLFLVVLFYLSFLQGLTDKRLFISIVLVAVLCFWVRGYPLWYNVFIPFYALSCRQISDCKKEKEDLC